MFSRRRRLLFIQFTPAFPAQCIMSVYSFYIFDRHSEFSVAETRYDAAEDMLGTSGDHVANEARLKN